MTTAYTSLLGLALPVTGELSGTWGDTVNNSITSLLDSAIAGTTTITADTTLSTTTGAANQSRQAILLCSPASANITITAPAQSKIYTVINTSATYTVKVVGVGPTTGVTLAVSESAVVAWNGSDFIRISSNSTFTAPVVIEGTTTSAALRITQLGTGNALLVEDSANPDSTPFVIDASGNVGIGTSSPTYKLDVTGISTVEPIVRFTAVGTNVNAQLDLTPTGVASGIINSTANNLGLSVASSTKLTVLSTGNVGIGTSSPAVKTNIVGSAGVTLRIEENSSGNNTRGDFSANITNVSVGAKSNSPLVFTTNDTERMRIDTSGRLLIGTTSASGSNYLQVNSDALINGLTVGRGAGAVSTNTAVGASALAGITTGALSTAVGYQAGLTNTTQDGLTAIGYQAGR